MKQIVNVIPLNLVATFELYDGAAFNYIHEHGGEVHQLVFEAQGVFERQMTFRELLQAMEVIFFCEYIHFGHSLPCTVITYRPNGDC